MQIEQPAQPVRLIIPGQINQPDEPAIHGPPAPAAAIEAEGEFFGADGFSFKDILDVINPFQQLPVVSTLYREETGETISAASRIVGGALLGGPVGFAVALANTIIEEATGKDVGSNVLAALNDTIGERLPAPQEPVPTHGAVARGHYSSYVRAQSLLS